MVPPNRWKYEGFTEGLAAMISEGRLVTPEALNQCLMHCVDRVYNIGFKDGMETSKKREMRKIPISDFSHLEPIRQAALQKPLEMKN